MDSCFPRLLNRTDVEAGIEVFFVGLEFQLRALTVGHQLRVMRRNSVTDEASAQCISSNVDPGDQVSLAHARPPLTPTVSQDAVQVTSCDSLYQDFFEIVVPEETDKLAIKDDSAKVLRSRITGKCIGVSDARVRMSQCTDSPVFFRNELRMDDSEHIVQRSVEIGVSSLISYGTTQATIFVQLHRRVLGGTVSVRVRTIDSNVTLIDDVGEVTRSPAGWVYLCRIVRTVDGDRYTLIRNGTVVDTQRRFHQSTRYSTEVPLRLSLADEPTAQVVLPSLKVVPLLGGLPRGTDDADRRYASGWRWRMYRRGGAYF
jgi:hypothetical protein